MTASVAADVTSSQVESFFKTLLLGDFVEDQNTAAQIVGGLVSLIPVLDQVMDARDITGTVFVINQRGGFKHAGPDQLVNLGFAAFGAVPEVGSAFKTVFKPMWKERRAAKGIVHSGLEAIEALRGMQKGAALTWVRQELLGKWSARTQQAIAAVTAALAACVELTDFVAHAQGWKGWLIPDSVQAMAGELLPGLKKMQAQINEPLGRASEEIRHFLEDLLGEQAAAVAMAAGGKAVAASAVPATRTKSGHYAADPHNKHKVPARERDRHTGGQHQNEAGHGGGPVHAMVQAARKTMDDLVAREKGLVGEHVVDYFELKRLGGKWAHDTKAGQWQPAEVKKLNADKRPVNLSLEDLPKVNQPGIDAVWEHHGRYTLTEAKASASIAAAYGFGKYKEKKGLIPEVSKLSADHLLLHYLLSDSSDTGGTQTPLMQMGVAWARDRAQRENLPKAARRAVEAELAHRRVVLVTFESEGADDHATALADLHVGKTGPEMYPHPDHGVTREWETPAIDAVDEARRKAHKSKVATPAPDPTPKPTRSRRS
jgi:hypothetical protein